MASSAFGGTLIRLASSEAGECVVDWWPSLADAGFNFKMGKGRKAGREKKVCEKRPSAPRSAPSHLAVAGRRKSCRMGRMGREGKTAKDAKMDF